MEESIYGILYPSKEKYSLQSMKQTENVYIVWHFHINTCQRYRHGTNNDRPKLPRIHSLWEFS